jgi:predicted N-acetyltransferase YhbS
MGLAPMAVLPDMQRQGIGTLLINKAFMILWLDKSKAGKVSGYAKYREEFNEAV